MPMQKWMTLNFLGFQLLWWVCVLSANSPVGGLVLLLVALVSAAQLHWLEGWQQVVPTLLAATTGSILDQTMLMAGWIKFHHQLPLAYVAVLPLWMMALWLAFANTLNLSMRWMQQHLFMAAVLGAIFGPVAYLAAEKLGAVQLPYSTLSLVLIAIEWAVALPLMLLIRRRFNQHMGIALP